MENNLDEILAKAAETKERLDQLKLDIKKEQTALDTLEMQILETMEASGLDSVKAHGFVFFPRTTESVRVPKTLEEKELLFSFLRERGIFQEMVSVNSQTLNALYKDLAAKAAEDGVLDFRIPGIEAPQSRTELMMRRG